MNMWIELLKGDSHLVTIPNSHMATNKDGRKGGKVNPGEIYSRFFKTNFDLYYF